WRSWWAYGVYFLIVVGIVAAFLRYQEVRVERIRKEQRLQVVERDLDIASAVQNFFLPVKKSLQSDRLKLAGFYRPADRCSGDWWWYEKLNDQRFWLLVGDVTGHGAGPAVVTASVATALRVQRTIPSANGKLGVDERLAHVNDEILALCNG